MGPKHVVGDHRIEFCLDDRNLRTDINNCTSIVACFHKMFEVQQLSLSVGTEK